MRLARSSQIREIDEYCKEKLGIPTEDLMNKSGEAVANVIKEHSSHGSRIAFLAGKGNNGGDAYAAATKLIADYDVVVYDIFSAGQRSPEGKHFLALFKDMGGAVINYDFSAGMIGEIKRADVIVDAVFGTGLEGEIPEELRTLSVGIREAVGALKIAIDVPLGINADNGSVSDFAVSVDYTVELSFIKPGIISYPARSFAGEVIYDTLGLPIDELFKVFPFNKYMLTYESVLKNLPKREENSNKSNFGKLLVITGSSRYRGAAHLGVEAALRGGVGYVTYAGEDSLVGELSAKYPEVIYRKTNKISDISNEEISELNELSKASSATLIGSGSDNTEGLLRLVMSMLSREGDPLILDADAINCLASIGDAGREALRSAKRIVILTPHPLEFAKIANTDVATVQLHRMELAESFAKEYGVVLVLKGARTIITDGEKLAVNTSGSSALAKAGSGDVLAGLLASLAAQKSFTPFKAACIAVSLHGIAADKLAREYSSYGVIPSDLPKEIARTIARMEKERDGI